MSKLQLFRDFVNKRLSLAALEISEQYEKTLAECQEEMCRSEEKSAQLQRMLDFQPEIKLTLHPTDVQLLSLPEPPQIKEEQDMWTSQGGEQLQGLQSDTKDSIFTSPRVKTPCDPEDSSQLPPLYQTPTVENRERDSLPTNTEKQIKEESDEEGYGDIPEQASDSQTPFITADCPTAQSSEEEERGGLLPELTCYLRPRPTRVLKSPIKPRRTQAKCSRPVPSPCSSPGPSLRIRTSPSPSPWTRPITSSPSGSERQKMTRVRERKTRNGIYNSPDAFNNAYQAVCEGHVSVRGAAGLFGVPYTTLQRFIKNKKENSGAPQPGYKPHNKVFTVEQEGSLRDYVLRASEIYFGLSPREIRRLAYQLAKKNKCSYPNTWDASQAAGRDWFSAYLLRNPQLSIRRPQATSLSRATRFNPTNVGNFFSNLSKVLDKHHFQAKDVWNLDETSTVTVQAPDKIAAGRGTKQVGAMTSAETGSSITMALAVNAVGNSIPPHFVFPRNHGYHDHVVRDGPTGCIGSCSGSGWMEESDFLLFLKHFVRSTRASPESKVLLLLDNHDSHLSLEGIDYCRANGVVLLSFPLHCSHKLQPLDRSVYGPLKQSLSSAMDRWMMVNPGKTMTIYDLPGIVATALPSAATPSNIMAGFRCTGIWPFNPTIFTERDFSDRPAPLPTNVAPAGRAESPESWSSDDDAVGPAPPAPATPVPHQSQTSPAIASSSALSPEGHWLLSKAGPRSESRRDEGSDPKI